MSVSSQIPLLDEGIRIHGEKSTEQLKPLHNRLVTCFQDLRAKVEKLYGVITLVSLTDSTLKKGFVRDRQRVCSFWEEMFQIWGSDSYGILSNNFFEGVLKSAKTTQGSVSWDCRLHEGGQMCFDEVTVVCVCQVFAIFAELFGPHKRSKTYTF